MRYFLIPHCIPLKNTIYYQMIDKKLELLLKTKNGRVIPAYLNPRMSFYSHISPEFIKTTDSNFIINEKLQNQYEKNLSNLLADIFRDAINCIISTERFCKENYPHLLRSIFTNPYIIDVGNFSEKLKILKDGGLALHLTKHSIERLYIQIFQSLRDIYKEFGEIIIDSPRLYKKPKNNYTESEEEILYQTILNEETINNDFFRNNILTKNINSTGPGHQSTVND